ncbi:hypothetical protein K6U17_00005 [Vibrio fluvialis]|nr:hypothetical protein [Vibrio fluvialis]
MLCAVMVKVFYRDIPLDVNPDESNE